MTSNEQVEGLVERVEALDPVQRQMVEACVSLGSAWVTASGSPNDLMLIDWMAKGWVNPVEPPGGAMSLAAYAFTAEALTALQETQK